MATLTTNERRQIWRGLMRLWSTSRETLAGINKADLQAAVDATDQWIEDNAASYNSALPATFRTNATAAQKTLLLCAVAARRVSVEFARRMLGGID